MIKRSRPLPYHYQIDSAPSRRRSRRGQRRMNAYLVILAWFIFAAAATILTFLLTH